MSFSARSETTRPRNDSRSSSRLSGRSPKTRQRRRSSIKSPLSLTSRTLPRSTSRASSNQKHRVSMSPGFSARSLLTKGNKEVNETIYAKTLENELSDQEIHELFTNVAIFNDMIGLGEDYSLLIQCLSVIKVNAGEILFKEGDTATFWGILLQGEINVSKKHVNVTTLKAGEIFGDYCYFIEYPKRRTTLQCDDDCIIAMTTLKEIDLIDAASPELGKYIRKLLARQSITHLTDEINKYIDYFYPEDDENSYKTDHEILFENLIKKHLKKIKMKIFYIKIL